MRTQENFSPERYQGKWFDVAHKEFKWQKGCQNSTAEYKWNGETLTVKNTCMDKDFKDIYSRTAVATIPDMNDKSKLKINFNGSPKNGSSEDGEGDYWVYWTDYDNFSIVGSDNGAKLWILSRNQKVQRRSIPMLLKKVESFGIDTSDIMSKAHYFY